MQLFRGFIDVNFRFQLKFNMIQHVHPELQNLYRWLELEFHPLKLSTRVTSSLEFLQTQDDLSQYVSALQDITITRLLKQVCGMREFFRLCFLLRGYIATRVTISRVHKII